MATIFNRTVDAVLSNRAGALRSSVGEHGGEVHFPFSQCQPPVSTWLGSRSSLTPEAAGGICSALSSHWIFHHARGSSLWNWLYPNGGVPHAGRLNQLMLAQAYSQTAHDQEAFEEHWLRSKGIIRRRHAVPFATQLARNQSVEGARSPAALAAASASTGIARFGSSQDQSGRFVGVYKRISIASGIGAHCMAVWTADDAVFFDPNFGEFYFRSREKFEEWFEKVFWRKSSYWLILNGHWSVSEFEVTHVAGER